MPKGRGTEGREGKRERREQREQGEQGEQGEKGEQGKGREGQWGVASKALQETVAKSGDQSARLCMQIITENYR